VARAADPAPGGHAGPAVLQRADHYVAKGEAKEMLVITK